eukprot:TRINITY_DN53_c0_g1_i1.p1 TRINITY_DN53_c0_g1~~TRINITY_DN53_c0_g1_i1.p1  ORF type:complete len:399 (-),score=34.38 TRINITY_DN53_c0_g1_i1:339-1535(-)
MNPTDQRNIESSDSQHRQRANSQHYRMAEVAAGDLQRQPDLSQSPTSGRRSSYDASMAHSQYPLLPQQYDIADPMHGIHRPPPRVGSHIQRSAIPQSPLELPSPHSTPPPQTALSMLQYGPSYGSSYDPKNAAYFQPHSFAGRNDQQIYHPYYGQYHGMPGSHSGYEAQLLQGQQSVGGPSQPHHGHPQRLSLYDTTDLGYSNGQSPSQSTSASGTPSPFMASRRSSRGNERSYVTPKREREATFESSADSELDNQRFDMPPAKRPKTESPREELEARQEQLLGPKTLDNDDLDGDDIGSGNESVGGDDTHDDRLESRPQRLVDISPYLNLPQKEAAKRLGLPVSTLSKRWKDATHDRKWPYRTIAKIDKEVMAILGTVPEVCFILRSILSTPDGFHR